MQGIQKVVRRLSLEGEMSEMQSLAERYQNVVLNADAESPVIYTDTIEVRMSENFTISDFSVSLCVCVCVRACVRVQLVLDIGYMVVCCLVPFPPFNFIFVLS